MKPRVFFALLSVFCGGIGAAGVACGSSSGNGFGDNPPPNATGTSDATTSTTDGTVNDARPTATDTDAPSPPPPPPPLRDGAPDGPSDAGHDAKLDAKPDSPTQPSEGGGGCSPINGPACDLVKQNCPRNSKGDPQQCVPDQLSDGGRTTSCGDIGAWQFTSKGSPCCIGPQGDPCLPGLQCTSNDRCSDASAPAGRCAPYCCRGDDSICGIDQTSGVPGQCDMGILFNHVDGTPDFDICSYQATCRPFGLKKCPPGYTCLVTDSSGSASCTVIFDPTDAGGGGDGVPCAAGNACADGFLCAVAPDAGGSCAMVCIIPGSRTPFDAGVLDGGPLQGGCPTGKQCNTRIQTLPDWYGVCR